jgi:macrodomain Ter protein organizer (MatP/YcbG family)
MALALDLPPVLLVRAEVCAHERGMPLAEYLTKLIEEALSSEPNARAISLLKAWEAEDMTDDPAELEARRADWEATKAELF